MCPGFDWSAYLAARGLATLDSVNVAQPDFVSALDGLIRSVPLETWKSELRWSVAGDAAPMLSGAFAEEDFRFQSVLSGTEAMLPRWKRCLRWADRDLGDLLGKAYVREKFPPAARERAMAMVRDLEAALGDRIQSLEWMSDATRVRALEKLHAFEEKIGYPNTWRDYAGVPIARAGPIADDAARYKQRSDRVADQFSSYTVLDTLHLNGRLTLGENTADLGGIAVAYHALRKALARKPAGPIDGFTPEQRFFLSYARVWASKQRPAQLRTQVQTNPHSPAMWRLNRPPSNLTEVQPAVRPQEGDPMVP